MTGRTLPGMVVLAGLMTVTTNAGGWGVITVKTLPDFVEAHRATRMLADPGEEHSTPARFSIQDAESAARATGDCVAGRVH